MKITITSEFPASLGAPSDPRSTFGPTLLEGIHSAVDPLLEDARSQTPYASIAAGYYSQDFVMGNGVAVEYGNASPIFPFREEDTRPHWPPFGKGSSLANWAEARGIPPFLVARKISRFGTTGNHIFGRARQQHQSAIDQAIQNASYAWVLENVRGIR